MVEVKKVDRGLYIREKALHRLWRWVATIYRWGNVEEIEITRAIMDKYPQDFAGMHDSEINKVTPDVEGIYFKIKKRQADER